MDPERSERPTIELYKRYLGTPYLSGGNAVYVEGQYGAYLQDPMSVNEVLRMYFDALQNVPAVDGFNARDIPYTSITAPLAERAKYDPIRTIVAFIGSDMDRKHVAATQLVATYRNVGLRWADLNPLRRQECPPVPDLGPVFHGFAETDQDIIFSVGNTYFGKESMSLCELIDSLRETYYGSVDAGFIYTSDQAQRRQRQECLEAIRSEPTFSAEKKRYTLERLTVAENLEHFLHTKYAGQKRSSLEGSESFITAMDELIQYFGAKDVQKTVIGMAHHGRLSVLVNMSSKTSTDPFTEFEGKHVDNLSAGGVKYHKDFLGDVATPGGPVYLPLALNPSHLEAVNPVVEGSVRVRQECRGGKHGTQVLAVQVHGDAAFADQGIVMETLDLAQTHDYGMGGTIHIITNNQIGFTTSNPRDSHSTLYCTDIVKMAGVPVLHANGDDPEAAVLAMQLAMDFRTKFQKNITVNTICSRKLGHNGQDTSVVTQPLMCKKIGTHPGTHKLYADKLVMQRTLKPKEPDVLIQEFRVAMDAGKHAVDSVLPNFKNKLVVDWLPFLNYEWTDSINTAVPVAKLKRPAERITVIPDHFKLHSSVENVVNNHVRIDKGEVPLD